MMRRLLGLSGPILSLSLLCGIASLTTASDSENAARVTYLTGSSVYIDAGRDAGLEEGDQLEVVREGVTVATLKVTYLSSRRASCAVVEGSGTLQVGDSVVLPSGQATEEGSGYTPKSTVAERGGFSYETLPKRRTRKRPIRGRVGVRYLSVKDRTGNGGTFSQPAMDLRLDGKGIAGGTLDLAADMRTRRTYRTMSDGNTVRAGQTRAYRLAMAWHDQDLRQRLTIGRQFSPSLASVSIFDGVMVDFNRKGWSAGLFSGTQPDPVDFSYSSEIREHGAYFQWHSKSRSSRPWSVTTGAVGSYQQGTVNREFFYVQGLYTGPRLAAYWTQEVDYNRDWKQEAGESTLSPTSSFLNLRYRVGKNFNIRAGFDNRRHIRLYRDFVTPVTDFDDTFRRGVWLGVSQRFGNRYRVSLDMKSSGGGTSGDADVYTMNFGANRISALNISLGYRGTHYVNGLMEGWLHALDAGMNLGSRHRLVLSGGVRDDRNLVNSQMDDRLTWMGLDLDFSLHRHWFLNLSGERTEGELEKNDQFYVSMSYRF